MNEKKESLKEMIDPTTMQEKQVIESNVKGDRQSDQREKETPDDQREASNQQGDVDLDNLTNEQAVSILIQGCRIAQSKGAYTFDQSTAIGKAISSLTVKK